MEEETFFIYVTWIEPYDSSTGQLVLRSVCKQRNQNLGNKAIRIQVDFDPANCNKVFVIMGRFRSGRGEYHRVLTVSKDAETATIEKDKIDSSGAEKFLEKKEVFGGSILFEKALTTI